MTSQHGVNSNPPNLSPTNPSNDEIAEKILVLGLQRYGGYTADSEKCIEEATALINQSIKSALEALLEKKQAIRSHDGGSMYVEAIPVEEIMKELKRIEGDS